MSGREVVEAGPRQLVPVTGTDQSIASRSDCLREQRLLDRDTHHHKQLWTKDAHGGQYRKVRHAAS